jgi:membrane-associated tyrosine/threonine-specific cdc2-inhibitory kinase
MDIKPENIFIGMDGICKLGDFGLMIDLAAAEGQGIEGDPKYLAPEALQGCYTKACDVFSLGVTLLELACDLELPRGGELWHELRRAGPAPGHTLHLQPELRRVLQLMMTRDEARRPSVRQLMELPSVRRAVRRRARQLLLARCWRAAGQAFSVALPLLHLLLELLLLLLRPLLGLLPATAAPPATPPPLSPAQAQASMSPHTVTLPLVAADGGRGHGRFL